MVSRVLRPALVVVLGAVAAPTLLAAQELRLGPCRTPDRGVWECFAADPVELAEGLRAQAEMDRIEWVLVTLVQLYRAYPPEALDALADSLVAIALEIAQRDEAERSAWPGRAARALVGAASWENPEGVAYRGAAERVIQMAHALPGGAPGLVIEMSHVIGRERVMEELRRFVASSSSPGATQAVSHLQFEGPEGVAVLREMYERGEMGPPARSFVEHLGMASGWRAPGSRAEPPAPLD